MSITDKPPEPFDRDALIDAFVSGDLGRGDMRNFYKEARRGPIYETEGAALEALWRRLADLPAPSLSADARLALQRPAPRTIARYWPAIAACLIAMVGSVTLWLASGNNVAVPAAPVQYVSARAELKSVRLPDGSRVTLSGETAIEVAYSPDERRIRLLRGEALFTVAKDKTRAFVVAAGDGEVRALGTIFNVRLDRRQVSVTVVEGNVAVRANHPARKSEARKLSAGQRLLFAPEQLVGVSGAMMSSVQAIDPAVTIDWTRGELQFSGEPLAAVIAEANRHSQAQIVLLDTALADQPIYGVLHRGDVDGLLSIIDATASEQHRAKRPAAIKLAQ